MDFSPQALFAGLVVSGIGLGLFLYGKRQMRIPQIVTGIVLMVVPLVAGAWWSQLAVSAGCVGALWLALRLGA